MRLEKKEMHLLIFDTTCKYIYIYSILHIYLLDKRDFHCCLSHLLVINMNFLYAGTNFFADAK